MWKANGKTTTLQLFQDSLSPKIEKLSLEETMDLSRDRLILEPDGSEWWILCTGRFAPGERATSWVTLWDP
jgi:hypothetical protein